MVSTPHVHNVCIFLSPQIEQKQNYEMFHVDHQNVSHPNNYVVLHFYKT